MKVTVVFTCFNRKEKTINCINSLMNYRDRNLNVSFIVVDDNSSDGTYEALANMHHDIVLLRGNGKLFWAGGMRKGIQYCLEHQDNTDFYMLVNDDVDFRESVIPKLLKFVEEYKNCVVVGSTCDKQGKQSYGMQKRVMTTFSARCDDIPALDGVVDGDTFNANCVLLPADIFYEMGNFDTIYHHALADWDYGFAISKRGYRIVNYDNYVGQCDKNSIKNTWKDTSLSRKERLRKKESPKGTPFKEWFYYLNKNFGLIIAMRYSISPYIRILIHK